MKLNYEESVKRGTQIANKLAKEFTNDDGLVEISNIMNIAMVILQIALGYLNKDEINIQIDKIINYLTKFSKGNENE